MLAVKCESETADITRIVSKASSIARFENEEKNVFIKAHN